MYCKIIILPKSLQPIYTHVILEVVNAPRHIRTVELEQRYPCYGFKFCKVSTFREMSWIIILRSLFLMIHARITIVHDH